MANALDKQKLALLHLLGFPNVPQYSDSEMLRLSVPLEKTRGITLKKSLLPPVPMSESQKEMSSNLASFVKNARVLQELIILEMVHAKLPRIHAVLREYVFVPELDLWNTFPGNETDLSWRILKNYTNDNFKNIFGNRTSLTKPNIRVPCGEMQKRSGLETLDKQYESLKREIINMLNTQDFNIAPLASLAFEAETKDDDELWSLDTAVLDEASLTQSLFLFLLNMYNPTTYPQQEQAIVDPTQKLCTLLHRLICNRDFILVRSVTEIDNSQLDLLSTIPVPDSPFGGIAQLSLRIEHALFVDNISKWTNAKFEFRYGIESGIYEIVLYWLAQNCQDGFGFFLYPPTGRVTTSAAQNHTKIAALTQEQVYDILQNFVYKAFHGNTGQKDLQKRLFLTKTIPERYAVSNHIFETKKE
jgi:hypothetical protein